MRLLLVRHAEAVDKGTDGVTRDFDRHLTPLGRQQAEALANALKSRGFLLSAVVSSPLVRAKQTAEPLAERLLPANPGQIVECEYLATDTYKPKKLAKFLEELGGDVVALVGHMPDLGSYVGWMIGPEPFTLDLEKAGAVLIHFPGEIEAAAGSLMWYVTPVWFL